MALHFRAHWHSLAEPKAPQFSGPKGSPRIVSQGGSKPTGLSLFYLSCHKASLMILQPKFRRYILVEDTDGFNYGYVLAVSGCRRKAAFSLASTKTRTDFSIIPIRNPLLIHVVYILGLDFELFHGSFQYIEVFSNGFWVVHCTAIINAWLYTGLSAGCRVRNLLYQLCLMQEISRALIFPSASTSTLDLDRIRRQVS